MSCVPVADFHNVSPDFEFTVALVLLLMVMLTIDVIFLSQLSRRFKQNAKEANAANEAKTDFLSRMSHDIRTPINVISGMTVLALSEKNPERTVEYLQNIQSSGRFLLGLVNDILDMNKVESGNMELHPKPYRSCEFISYVNAVIAPLCTEKNINFVIDNKMEDIPVILDSLRFNQIFFNLLSNAVKFTSVGGNITLSCSYVLIGDERIALDISVKDDGIGMSEEFQQRMFQPFSQEERTLERNSTGTGLGLAIVNSLIKLMKGTLRVESAVGKGTTFFVHIETDVAQQSLIEPELTYEQSDLSGRRILLCEDHPLNAKIIVRLLAQKSVEVEVAVNGKLGVERFTASEQWRYDAILMDIRMPVMNGIDAAKAIRSIKDREDAQHIPIIALTANAYDSDVKSCIDAGMNAHLSKPVDTEKLCETLARLIAERTAI